MKANPPWLTDLIGDFWETLEAKVPPEWMPKLSDVRAIRGRVTGELVEYGCGSYGCVVPTEEPNIVLKATTDSTETQYAAEIAHTVPVNVTTEYFMAVALSAKVNDRPVALLWREAADDVGKVQRAIGGPAGKQAITRIIAQHRCATMILKGLIAGKSAGDMQAEIAAWMSSLDTMAETAELRFVALGMKQCFAERGVMFLDVHEENLGRVQRDGKPLWVITDPGNVVVVDDARAKLKPSRKARRNPAPRWAESEHEIAGFEYEQAVRNAFIDLTDAMEEDDREHVDAGYLEALRESVADPATIASALGPVWKKANAYRAGYRQIVMPTNDAKSLDKVLVFANPFTLAWTGQRVTPPYGVANGRSLGEPKPHGEYKLWRPLRDLFDGVAEVMNRDWPVHGKTWIWDVMAGSTAGLFVFMLADMMKLPVRLFALSSTWTCWRPFVPDRSKWLIDGAKVRFVISVDRYPDFVVPTGMTGNLVEIEARQIGVLMDYTIDGADEWDNVCFWTPETVDMVPPSKLPASVSALSRSEQLAKLTSDELEPYEYAPFDDDARARKVV